MATEIAESRAAQYFGTELDRIKNPNLQAFAQFCLDKAPLYFWLVPSSSTGKYHPPQSNGRGGLVRHVKAMLVFCETFIRMNSLTGDDADCARVACLTHDIVKYGPNDTPLPHTTKDHDRQGALFVHQLGQLFNAERAEDKRVPDATLRLICGGIAWHAGQWASKQPNSPKRYPTDFTLLEQTVHQADMAAATPDVCMHSLMEPTVGVG
jgi:hypothetical protein